MRYAVLVYQAGIANVFEVTQTGKTPTRLLQHAFKPCEWFARGLAKAGWHVHSMHCNRAGDITDQPWDSDLDTAPFRESMHPVFTKE